MSAHQFHISPRETFSNVFIRPFQLLLLGRMIYVDIILIRVLKDHDRPYKHNTRKIIHGRIWIYLSCLDRHSKPNLFLLEWWRLRIDVIQCFKFSMAFIFLNTNAGSKVQGKKFLGWLSRTLVKQRVRTSLKLIRLLRG